MPSGEKPPRKGTPQPPSGGPVKFGPFWLESRLAVGGTAEVFLARPIDPESQPRRLVVKRLLPQFLKDPEGRTMFEREAALHGAVRHENVVKVHGFGTVGDEPWLAMELIDGCDLFRLLRRVGSDGRVLGPRLSVHIAREILNGLQSVHTASDSSGHSLGIIHRDVTPSNVYLSSQGRVALGDFGIARTTRATPRKGGEAMLKGKFAYLAPEQVAGEPFDHRADLFALGAVLSEMLLGHPLFAGSGQLAVLLAIRDCRIDSLKDVRASLPAGLFEVLERVLVRDPSARTASAAALSAALLPFDPDPSGARSELGALVRWVMTAPSVEQMQAVRDSAARLRARNAAAEAKAADAADAAKVEEASGAAEVSDTAETSAAGPDSSGESDRATGEYASIPSHVVTRKGSRLGPWTFARLVEAIATGRVTRGDSVDYMGRGLALLEHIEELARFLPASPATTSRIQGVSAPEFASEVSPAALLRMLARVAATETTGVLFAEGPPGSLRPRRAGDAMTEGRKELYFVGGKLHHVASNNASEMLGEYLVRRRAISRDELDFALAVLPRYNGRMGDTLIALGLVGSLEIFRTIRDQGRDRLVDLFRWRRGKLHFYAEQTAPHVDFPLDLELAPLLLAGIEAAEPGEAPLTRWRDRLDAVVMPVASSSKSEKLRSLAWPPSVRQVLETVSGPAPIRDVLSTVAQAGTATANDALRALEVLVEAALLVVQESPSRR